MKPSIAAACLALLLLTTAADAPDRAAQVGRFQLVPAMVQSGSLPAAHRLFRLDTITGQAWEYVGGVVDGAPVSGWLPIKQP